MGSAIEAPFAPSTLAVVAWPAAMGDTDLRDRFADVEAQQDDVEARKWSSAIASTLFGKKASAPKIGRYEILERIGTGGNGQVFAAHDPELDREVAVKLLRADRNDVGRQARLRREAQALARLSHPNVVPVYDVGVFEEQVFVTMEFVRGQPLSSWLGSSHPWPLVIERLVQAGRGLAAAHAAGVVHRDFKPDNVMVGDDGRVRVMDFGLARSGGPGPDTPSLVGKLVEGSDPAAARLTETGVIMGTPAYMAPEQHRGEQAHAAADQFSFCVALYEGLFGHRPFAGNDVATLARNVEDGRSIPPPARSEVPRRIRQAVVRGLDRDPQRRWPTMQALVDELEDQREARRRRWSQAAMAVVGVVGVASAVASIGGDDVDLCADAQTKLDAAWDADRKAAVAQAFLGSELSYASDTWSRLEPAVDGYREAWVDAYRDACEATHVRGDQPEALLDQRMACLDERRRALDALTEVFTHGGASVVERAVSATAQLPAIDRCADPAYVAARIEPPGDAEQRRAVEELELQLARSRARQDAGVFAEAIADTEQTLKQAEAIGYAPTIVAARVRLGALQLRAAQYEPAAKILESAYLEARGLGLDTLAFEAASELAYVVGAQLARSEEGQHWAKLAAAEATRSGDPVNRARAFDAQAAVDMGKSNFAAAAESYRRALEVRTGVWGDVHPLVADTRTNRGSALTGLGDLAAARVELENALEIYEQVVGPDHPRVGTSLATLGTLVARDHKYAEAMKLHERALEIKRRALGDDHPSVATSLSAIGNLAGAQGDLTRALELVQQAHEIRTNTLGPKHPNTARNLINVADALMRVGRHREAESTLEQSLDILTEIHGTDRASACIALNGLADLALAERRDDDARALFERTTNDQCRIDQRQRAYTGLATVALDAGDAAAAIAQTQRGLELVRAEGAEANLVAIATHHHSIALFGDPARRDEAVATARRAAKLMDDAGLPGWGDTVLRWLEHPTGFSRPGDPETLGQPFAPR